ncbi:AN1-type zinc finger protein 5-like [Grus japonensis]|uniref:AN1-type zinc finger protein 5-like n=1 Tax=Grus japonensis TaxID=30415 RepID=A0ABC9WTR8_GRUJA
MPNRANASWLQGESVAGQGQAHQRQWWCPWDNTVKKREKRNPHKTQNCTSATAAREKSENLKEICERNNSADTKVSEGGGKGGAPGAGAEIPFQPMVRQAVPLQPIPLQPMEVNSGADIHLQPIEDPMPEQVDVPEGGCDPVGSPHWSRFAGRTCKGPTLEQFVPKGLHLVEGTHAGAVRGGLSPMGGTPGWSRGRA